MQVIRDSYKTQCSLSSGFFCFFVFFLHKLKFGAKYHYGPS